MRRIGTIALGLLLCTGSARAGGAEDQRLTGDDFAKGTLEGLSVDAEGWLQPGLTSTPVALDVPTTWATSHREGVTWIGTGNTALVLRVDSSGKVQRIQAAGESGGLLVTAIAALPDGGAAAAVSPGGRIVTIAKDGSVKALAVLPVEFVWALAADDKGHLTAACGGPGVVYAIDPFGAVEKRGEVFDEHARCLTVDGERLLVGTSPKGLVVEIRKQGTRVLRDLEYQEVTGIVVGDGGLLVGANADTVGGNAGRISGILGQIARPSETDANEKPADRPALQNGAVFFLSDDGATETLWEKKKTAVISMCADAGGAFVGTQPDGRLISVRHGKVRSKSMLDFGEGEVSALALQADGLPLAVTSNPGVLHRTQRAADKTGTWTSAALDPGARARWGAVRVWGEGVTSIEFRHGETEEPDDTWAAWTQAGAVQGGRGDTGVTARFLQLRVKLQTCRAIEIVRRTPNRAPVITEFAETAKTPETDTGLVKGTPVHNFTWKVEDPDSDPLRTNLTAQRDGSPRRTKLVDNEVLPKPGYAWDTTGWPDGLYHLRLAISDAIGNPGTRARETVETLMGVRVDNTPPRVTLTAKTRGNALVLFGEADDGADGRLRFARVSINGDPWIQLAARDGLFDTGREAFESTVSDQPAGTYDIVLQVSDAEGNLGTRAAVLTIPAR